MTPSVEKKRRGFGILVRRSLWVPSWKGWLLLLLLLLVGSYVVVRGIHPFLAIDAPVVAKVMVVEGWIPMPALQAAADRFRAEGYEMLCTVGGPFPGEQPDSPRNHAVVVADQFLEMGIPAAQVFAVPSGKALRDRTYTSAKVLNAWFLERGGEPESLNVVTQGPHSRRSRLFFESAFGDEVDVGVISIPNSGYDDRHWWRSSEGVKEVMSEGGAYLYARFLFRPD